MLHPHLLIPTPHPHHLSPTSPRIPTKLYLCWSRANTVGPGEKQTEELHAVAVDVLALQSTRKPWWHLPRMHGANDKCVRIRIQSRAEQRCHCIRILASNETFLTRKITAACPILHTASHTQVNFTAASHCLFTINDITIIHFSYCHSMMLWLFPKMNQINGIIKQVQHYAFAFTFFSLPLLVICRH